jgi:tRNA dimethylallyltransferase
VLRERLATRTARMLSQGWADEAKALRLHVPADAPAWKATGYAHVVAALDGRLTWDAARDAIVTDTRQYAKRQRTWVRHQLPPGVPVLSPDDPQAAAHAMAWFQERS